jgi:uncharacterized membrane protein
MELDESCGLLSQVYLSLMIEISDLQKLKGWLACAWKFIQRSCCHIVTVIGINMNYSSTTKAPFLIWQKHCPLNASGTYNFFAIAVIDERV